MISATARIVEATTLQAVDGSTNFFAGAVRSVMYRGGLDLSTMRDRGIRQQMLERLPNCPRSSLGLLPRVRLLSPPDLGQVTFPLVRVGPRFFKKLCPVHAKIAGVPVTAWKSRVFAPPLRPPDPVRCTSGLHDGPLIGGTESPIEAGQRGLDEPRFEGHPCGLAVGIKFPGHSQRHQCRCDAPGCHNYADDDAG